MKNAGTAMKHIHAGLTIDKVDDVMCVLPVHHFARPRYISIVIPDILLTPHQGRPPRAARNRRRDQRSNNLKHNSRRHRRRRARRRARRAAAGEARRGHAEDWQRARRRQGGRWTDARRARDRSQGQGATAGRGRRRGGRIEEAASRDGYVSACLSEKQAKARRRLPDSDLRCWGIEISLRKGRKICTAYGDSTGAWSSCSFPTTPDWIFPRGCVPAPPITTRHSYALEAGTCETIYLANSDTSKFILDIFRSWTTSVHVDCCLDQDSSAYMRANHQAAGSLRWQRGSGMLAYTIHW